KRKISPDIADKVLDVVTTTGKSDQLIKKFKTQMKNIPEAIKGLEELETIFNYLKTSKVNSKFYQFSPFIARGLAYYTGPVWEFEILEGNIGSVAGCGRYDNTIGNLIGSGKQVPATGGSFGIERIVEVIKDRKMIKIDITPVKALVTWFADKTFDQSLVVANKLRNNNISTMLYPEMDKLNKQLKYADQKQIPFVIIIGPDEVKKNLVTLKNMNKKSQTTLPLEKVIAKLRPKADQPLAEK
ncbi:ATP phosphoribosyltransferase regulatory subunit, partial [Patescibacteria group bacterium]|nr:ATP phosphoribosyltransferase regulatory subunit [Patescibacteria group bacterium]